MVIPSVAKSALMGVLIVLPFMLLQFRFNSVGSKDVPDLAVLFGLIWLLATASIFTIIPLAQTVQAGQSLAAKPATLVLRVAISALMVVVWISLIVDQLPCFLGVPNCD